MGFSMVMSDLEKLRRLSEYADQISSISLDGDDARNRIGQLITRAEDDIRTKSLEIEVRQSQISLLKHIASVLPQQGINGNGHITQPTAARPAAQAVPLKASMAEH